MAVGDKQKLITEIVAVVLNEKPQIRRSFDWFVNKHTVEYFGKYFTTIEKIFEALSGDITANQSKRTLSLDCDAFFGGSYNFMFEFDEYQHFSTARLKTLKFYPQDLKLNFSVFQWKQLCEENREQADRYRKAKQTIDFNFVGGRTAQRAYLDCFRDLLPEINGLKPTIRISEFEVIHINDNDKEARSKMEKILISKLGL